MDELFTLDEASAFASEYVGKEVTVSNINYLIQYGRIDKTLTSRGLCVSKNQLIAYYITHLRECTKLNGKISSDKTSTGICHSIITTNQKQLSMCICYIHIKENIFRNWLGIFWIIMLIPLRRKYILSRAILFSIRFVEAERHSCKQTNLGCTQSELISRLKID